MVEQGIVRTTLLPWEDLTLTPSPVPGAMGAALVNQVRMEPMPIPKIQTSQNQVWEVPEVCPVCLDKTELPERTRTLVTRVFSPHPGFISMVFPSIAPLLRGANQAGLDIRAVAEAAVAEAPWARAMVVALEALAGRAGALVAAAKMASPALPLFPSIRRLNFQVVHFKPGTEAMEETVGTVESVLRGILVVSGAQNAALRWELAVMAGMVAGVATEALEPEDMVVTAPGFGPRGPRHQWLMRIASLSWDNLASVALEGCAVMKDPRPIQDGTVEELI